MAARRLSLRLAILSFLFAFAVSRPARPEDVVLRWKFKEGQVLAETMEVKSTTLSHFGGSEAKSSQAMVMDYTRTVQKVGPDGKADVVQKMERIRMQLAAGGQNIDYDSRSGKDLEGPAGGMLMPMFKAMIGAEIKFQMTPLGKVENVKLPEVMLKAIQQSPAGAASGGMFSEESIKQMCEVFPGLYDGPVTPGKTWNDHRKIPFQFGFMHAENAYTYEGTEKKDGKDLHKLGLKASLSLQKDPQQTIDIKLKPNQSSGTLYFDGVAGRFVEMVQSQKVNMDIGGEGTPSVEVSTDTTTTWRLEEKTDAPKGVEKKPAESK